MFGKKKKQKRSTQEAIPYYRVYPNGVIETKEGTFTKAYELQDINFKIAPDDEQKRVFLSYIAFLNSFPVNVRAQVVIMNTKADKRDTIDWIRFVPQRDGLNSVRSEMNRIMLDKVIKARNSLVQKKYLIISIQDDNVAHAMHSLEGYDIEIKKSMRAISKDIDIRPQTSEERLRILFEIYNQDGENSFENDVDEDNRPQFALKNLRRRGLTTKDLIAPTTIQPKMNHIDFGNIYSRSMFLADVPTWLSTDFLSDLSSVSSSLIISIQYDPIDQARAIRMVKDKMTSINAEIAGQQQSAIQNGYGFNMLNPELEQAQKQTKEMIEDIAMRDQKTFFCTITATVFGKTKEELDYNSRQIMTIGNRYVCPMRTLNAQQLDGFNSCLPLCINNLQVKRLLTSESGAVFLPYTAQELRQKNGVFYGINETTNNLIVYSRISGQNANGLIFGQSGSGKSMFAKNEILSVLLKDEKNRVYVIDPESEYKKMADLLKGEVINLAPGSRTYLNPLDMDLDYDGESDPLSMKTDYIISMIDIMLGDNRYMDPRAKSIVGRCVRNIYRPYIEHIEEMKRSGFNVTCDKDAMPTILNLYNELLRQEEPEARSIASVLEIYATGTLSTFAHRSNVDSDNRFVVYDIKNLGTGMKNLGLHVCLNDIWNKMIDNKKKDLWSWIYIDEFHVLLKTDSAASFLSQIWLRARKWNGLPTGILQNTEDLMKTADSRHILGNTDFVSMLSLSRQDRINVSDMLQIPESQLGQVTNAEPGHGLLYAGKAIVPFYNEYPKDSFIYKVISTSRSKDQALRG